MYDGQLPDDYGSAEGAELFKDGVISMTPFDRGDGEPLYIKQAGVRKEVFSPQTPEGVNYWPDQFIQEASEQNLGGDGKLSEIFSKIKDKVGDNVGEGKLRATLAKFATARRVTLTDGSVIKQAPDNSLYIERSTSGLPVGEVITKESNPTLWSQITGAIGTYRRPIIGATKKFAASPTGQGLLTNLLSRLGVQGQAQQDVQQAFQPSQYSLPATGPEFVPTEQKKDRTLLYVGLGVGALLLAGVALRATR